MALNLVQFLEIEEEQVEFPRAADGKELLHERAMNAEVKEFLRLDADKKRLERRMKDIKAHATTYVLEHGQETDKGHLESDLTSGRIQYQLRKSISLNHEDAVEFCEGKDFDDCYEEVTMTVLKEYEFEERCRAGDITKDDLEGLVDISENRVMYIKR